jgi:NAD(P)-dependent dehydrogenase (short-subunit alcohol dehydrogenase family)
MELNATSSEEVIGHVATDAVSIWGRVDVVVNNAAWVTDVISDFFSLKLTTTD